VSHTDAPDGVPIDEAPHCAIGDIIDNDGQQLLHANRSTLLAPPIQSNASVDGERVVSSDGWGQGDQTANDVCNSTALTCHGVRTRSAYEQASPTARAPQQEMDLTPQIMATRADSLFPSDATWPVGSPMAPLTGKLTKGLVVCAHSITNGWSKQYVMSRSRAYGNFDRAVALGWLIGNALGHPLLGAAEAFTIGPEAKRKAAAIKAEVAEARRAVQRLKAKFESDAEREAAKDEAA